MRNSNHNNNNKVWLRHYTVVQSMCFIYIATVVVNI